MHVDAGHALPEIDGPSFEIERLDQAQFQRLRARRGAKKAIIAVAASMLTAAYHILRDSVPYKDLGPGHFTRRDTKYAARRLQRRLEDLGFAVEIRPTTAGVSI